MPKYHAKYCDHVRVKDRTVSQLKFVSNSVQITEL